MLFERTALGHEGLSFNCGMRFYKAHYETYPYFIHYNRLLSSPFRKNQFLVLKFRLRMHINRLFGAHTVDTKQWHCHEHFKAQIDVKRDWFSVQ